jgi:hypothetical protein
MSQLYLGRNAAGEAVSVASRFDHLYGAPRPELPIRVTRENGRFLAQGVSIRYGSTNYTVTRVSPGRVYCRPATGREVVFGWPDSSITIVAWTEGPMPAPAPRSGPQDFRRGDMLRVIDAPNAMEHGQLVEALADSYMDGDDRMVEVSCPRRGGRTLYARRFALERAGDTPAAPAPVAPPQPATEPPALPAAAICDEPISDGSHVGTGDYVTVIAPASGLRFGETYRVGTLLNARWQGSIPIDGEGDAWHPSRFRRATDAEVGQFLAHEYLRRVA